MKRARNARRARNLFFDPAPFPSRVADFHKKGCALGLILKVRVFGTRKWPIKFSFQW